MSYFINGVRLNVSSFTVKKIPLQLFYKTEYVRVTAYNLKNVVSELVLERSIQPRTSYIKDGICVI